MASPVDTSVKFALSSMTGAPVISGQAGSRISAIKAFAVTGWGVKTVDAGGSISAGKCRLPFSSGASAAIVNSVIQVSGATPGGLNGDQKITAVSSTWVEFATALPDGAVTGSVTFKMAPVGWEEVFTKTNVSVFRPTDLQSSRPYIRIDDSNATYAVVQMYESMTDVDTGVNGTPARYWLGRSSASANAVSWTLVGDSRGMFVCIAPNTTSATDYSTASMAWYVGDQISDRNGDPYPALLMGNSTNSATSGDGALFNGTTAQALVMRIGAGVGGAVATNVSSALLNAAISGADPALGAFPSRAAQALLLAPVFVADGGTFAVTGRRGRVPGARYCPQTGVLPVYGAAPAQVKGSGDFAAETMLTINVHSVPNAAASGVGFINIAGPWRKPA